MSLLAAAALVALPVLSPQSVHAAQVQHEGVSFDTVARVGGEVLQLNGMGLRGVAWIRAFVAGLYVPQPSRDAQRLMQQPGAKRLTLKILLDAPAAELGKAVRRGVPRNLAADEMITMAPRLESLASRIDDIGRVHPGDILDLDYEPARGMVARVNGQVRGNPIPGEDLYRAVLAIFIGERPVDPRLKAGLLAGGVGLPAGTAASASTGEPAAAPAQLAAPEDGLEERRPAP